MTLSHWHGSRSVDSEDVVLTGTVEESDGMLVEPLSEVVDMVELVVVSTC